MYIPGLVWDRELGMSYSIDGVLPNTFLLLKA